MTRFSLSIAAVVALYCVAVSGKQGYGPGEQAWGYVDVRTGAHMFYWIYLTNATTNYTERPLAIWLQGGPGAGSTGYGNFEELGPLDINGNPREHTWVKDMNVLFIDSPVGAGYSYVDDLRYLASDNNQIAKDLVNFMKGFYKLHPEFEEVPLHIFSQSYGGKVAPEFALELWYAIRRGELKSNFKSVALVSPWTSPIDTVLSWAPLLLNMGIVDEDGYERVSAAAEKTAELVEAGKWAEASNQWSITQRVVGTESNGVDFYDILKPVRAEVFKSYLLRSYNNQEKMFNTLVDLGMEKKHEELLNDLMNGPVAEALNIPGNVFFGSQRRATFNRLAGDFMKPVVGIVAELLDNTDLKVAIISGQKDLVCATPGTVNWIDKMQWSYKSEYLNATRDAIGVNRVLEGYEKSAGNFAMFWVNRAGHSVPAENPAAMGYILRKLTNFG